MGRFATLNTGSMPMLTAIASTEHALATLEHRVESRYYLRQSDFDLKKWLEFDCVTVLATAHSIARLQTNSKNNRMLNDSNNLQANLGGVLYRHGDVLIRRIDRLPIGVQKREGVTLAHGEVTGHRHRLQQANAVQLWGQGSELFLEVKQASATLVHEEHRAIELPRGFYQVWRQREYRPDAYVEVMD